ncbi:TIGR00341 family protein [Acaryochloris sp. IP29b_bin.148]|uniref:TIGR00341 family protein n=1 Tax=Acaryochloris sp. IP29b_bin.148 TaxID=2969218 RepID=UPI0026227A35|nr:TIGR00341 family protein [Acaryochloris sp. IP29b_bin.148]
MNVRLLEIDTSSPDRVLELLKDIPCIDIWQTSEPACIRVTVRTPQVEQVLHRLQTNLANPKVLILPVEAQWPVPDLEAPCNQTAARLSREEIYTKVGQQVQITGTQIGLVVLSTLIVAIGLLKGSEAILIGGMVLAPLLQPILGLAVAAVLGDFVLAKQAIKVGGISIGLVLGLTIFLGIVSPIPTDLPGVMARVRVEPMDAGLAVAAGIASALSLTSDNQNAMVGVMVAVAILPPLVVLGLLIGAGEWALAPGAFLLVLTNVIGLNLAATATLTAQNLELPFQWRQQAQGFTQRLLGMGMILILGIMGVVTWQQLDFGNILAQASTVIHPKG